MLAGISLLLYLSGPASAGKMYYSVPGLVDESTGLMESYVAGDWYRGSAVIARDPKLIYSCAHLFYERGKWATDYIFHRAYHSADEPGDTDAAYPRGLNYFTSYSTGVKAYGANSDAAFASDFTILYGNTGFGPAASWWPRGGPALKSNQLKRVVGYPVEIDFTGESGRAYQHTTGWFNYTGFRMLGNYYDFDNVSTGPGNSGGPIFVRDSISGQDRLAGILVSGSRRTAGVVALDLASDTMAGYVLGLKNQTLTFSNANPLLLPDGGAAFSSQSMEVAGFSGSIAKLKFSMAVTTSYRGDLEIYLRSPAGRIRWITKRSGGSLHDLIISGADFSGSFKGQSPNGIWELRMRDTAAGDPATFQNCSLTVSAL